MEVDFDAYLSGAKKNQTALPSYQSLMFHFLQKDHGEYTSLILIGLFMLVRMIGITDPPLEKGHNWRQTTGLMVARNFLESDPNILYPRVDEYGPGSGIIGMEFPSLNYAHFLMAKVWGYQHWYGRLINLILSSLGIWFYARILAMRFRRRTVIFSTLILLGSIWFGFSRKMMPDTWCISWMLIATYYGLRFLLPSNSAKHHYRDLILFFLLATFATLSKISALVYLGLFIPILVQSGLTRTRSLLWMGAALLSVAISAYWYFIWNPHLAAANNTWYNSGQAPLEGLKTLIAHPVATLRNFYFLAFNGYILFAFSLAGLVFLLKEKAKEILWPLTGITFLFAGYMIISGHYFHSHSYYIIPFVPVLALLAGYAIDKVKSPKLAILLVLIGVGESIANQQHDFRINDSELYKLELEKLVDEVAEQDALICVNGNGNPQQLYLAHRKGWVVSDAEIQNMAFLDSLQQLGCRIAVVDVRDGDISLPFGPDLVISNYKIYSLPKTPSVYDDFK